MKQGLSVVSLHYSIYKDKVEDEDALKVVVRDSIKLAWRINHEHYLDGFFGMIVEGKQRIGKSSFCCQSLAEAFGEWEYEEEGDTMYAHCKKPNYEEVKKWVVFPPKQFLDKILSIDIGDKEKAIYWSDAGFWLFVLDWYQPFVKSVAKYIQLSGRQFAAVFFSTPNKKLLSSKVIESIPEIYVCRIIKESRDTPRFRPRIAKIYERWDYPDGKKGGVRTRWHDKFNAIMPDHFFSWYKPISDHYLEIGRDILEAEVAAMRKKTKTQDELEEQLDKVAKVVGEPNRLKEVSEVLEQYA